MTDLKELQSYYEQNLTDRIFRYTLANGVVIEVSFYRESFCHLLGIQHVTKNRRYIGGNGYEYIRSGKLTVGILKGMNRTGFAKIKNRIEYFPLIGHLMEHGDVFRLLQALFEKNYQIISYQYKSDHAGFCSLTWSFFRLKTVDITVLMGVSLRKVIFPEKSTTPLPDFFTPAGAFPFMNRRNCRWKPAKEREVGYGIRRGRERKN